jgi:hypothetical protein
MSKHCYVIAGGPSLIGFDFSALPPGFRIGVNRCAWLANCDALVTIDSHFYRTETERIAGFGANAHVALPESYIPIPGVTYWYYARCISGLSFSPNMLAGSSPELAALNLAVQLGFTEIALLGFDMKWPSDQSDFHGRYGVIRIVDHDLAVWAEEFQIAERQLAPRGINVTNFVGPFGSRIRAFPVAPLSDLF